MCTGVLSLRQSSSSIIYGYFIVIAPAADWHSVGLPLKFAPTLQERGHYDCLISCRETGHAGLLFQSSTLGGQRIATMPMAWQRAEMVLHNAASLPGGFAHRPLSRRLINLFSKLPLISACSGSFLWHGIGVVLVVV